MCGVYRGVNSLTQISDLPTEILKLWVEWGGLLGPDSVIPQQYTIGFVDDVRGSHFPQVMQNQVYEVLFGQCVIVCGCIVIVRYVLAS